MSDDTNQARATYLLSNYFEDYLAQYQMDWDYHNQAIISPLEVDELASKIAGAYERVRKVIDWKEENILRRSAIERMLKRRFISKLYGISIMPNLQAEEIAKPMVLELMRSGYFDNNLISRVQVEEVEAVLDKYIQLLSQSSFSIGEDRKQVKKRMNFYTWVIEIAACEIEEVLSPGFKETAALNLMTNVLYARTKVIPANKISPMDKFIQTYAGVHRALYNFDNAIINYHLIKIKYPFWVEEDEASIQKVIQQAATIRRDVESDLEDKRGKLFFKVANKYDAAYRIIADIVDDINDKPSVVKAKFANEAELDRLIEATYEKRRKSLKKRLFRSAIYSTLSIFVSGGVSFVIFEGPVARWAGLEFSLISLLLDMLIPSLVMFLLVIIIRPPRTTNLPVLKQEVKKVVYQYSEEDSYEVELNKKRNKVMNTIFLITSTLAGVVGLRFIFWIFKIANVPWTSMYIDTVNVAMVFFAAMAIKQQSKEITIEERSNFFEALLELFSIPLAKIGEWFSDKWKEYNIVAALMTVLVDTPFSLIIGLIEDWRNFLKERSSEIH